MTSSAKAEPAALIQKCLDRYVADALRTNKLLDPPVEALRFAAAALLKLTQTRNLREAERAVGGEFLLRLELRLVAQDNAGHAGACVRHVRDRLASTFRLLN